MPPAKVRPRRPAPPAGRPRTGASSARIIAADSPSRSGPSSMHPSALASPARAQSSCRARRSGRASADHQDGAGQVLEEVAEQRQRVVVRVVQVLEDEADRRGGGVRLEERLEDGAADERGLLRLVLDGARERALVAGHAHELAEEVGHVADLAARRGRPRSGRAPGPGGLPFHALDEAEARPEQLGEDAERAPPCRGRCRGRRAGVRAAAVAPEQPRAP